MKTVMLLSTMTLFVTSGPQPANRPVPPNHRGVEHRDVRDLVGSARISLHDAIGKALAARPGRVVEAELEGESSAEGKSEVFFEVLVLTGDDELVEVRLDVQDGKVISSHEADAEEHEEVAGFAAALRHSERTLDQLVTAAEAVVKGTPVRASLEFDDGSPVCTVALVNTRWVIEAELEGRAGHLVDIDLRDEPGVEDHVERADEEHGNPADGEERERGREERGGRGKHGKTAEEHEDGGQRGGGR